MSAPCPTRQDIALVGFHSEYFNVGILLFQILRGTGDGASSTLRKHESANLAFRLFPDFRPGRTIMGLDIIDVDELINLPIFARSRRFEFFDLVNHQVYVTFSARGEYQFGAIGANGFLAL